MTKVAAISVQPASRPTTARPAAPVTPAKKTGPASVAAAPVAQSLPPQASPVAAAVLSALIEVQAKVKAVDPQPTHGNDDQHGPAPVDPPVVTPPVVSPPVVIPPVVQPPVAQPPVSLDPNPDHGNDDQHGHKPPVTEPPPPVVQPPVAQPPVVQPPVIQPPVVQPPKPAPRSDQGADPTAAGRAAAMVDRFRADVRVSQMARSAFEAQAAQRQAFASIIEDHSAVALLQVLQAGMIQFDAGFSASKLRRGFYA